MDNIKNDNYYINKIKNDLNYIYKKTKDLSYEEFVHDETLTDSIMFRFIQISENGKHLSDELKEKNPLISWKVIKGFRNRIVHDYGSIDFSIVFNTCKENVPLLINQLENIIK